MLVALALLACSAPSTSGLPGNASAGRTPGATGTLSTTVTATQSGRVGMVALTPTQARFASAGAITITVYNGLLSSIFAEDNHSSCTIIQLERESSGAWQGAGGCVNAQPFPQMIEITAGQSVSISLAPVPQADVDSTLLPGTYRAVVTYVSTSNEAIGQGVTVYSQAFTVS